LHFAVTEVDRDITQRGLRGSLICSLEDCVREGAQGAHQMNHASHERIANAWRQPWRSLLLSVGLPAALVFVSTVALAQFRTEPAPDGTICPLSDAQTQKSIDAFSKIFSVITSENRCLGCHGRVNPYIDGIGEEKGEPDIPKSLFDHGGGKMDRVSVDATGKTIPGSFCNGCHSKMARTTKGNHESIWMTAPAFLAFVGRDAPTICKQIRGNLPTGKDFIGHLTDDNGGNNFAGTAFNGDRGLDRDQYPPEEVPTEKPRIQQKDLLKLAQNWVDSTGGEFKGDKSCGCEPVHYAIRVSTVNDISVGPVHRTSVMQPVDVPITFDDDGTFKGDGAANFQGTATSPQCIGTSGSGLTFHASGQAIETSRVRSMHFQFANSSPTVTNSSITCPTHEFKTQTTTAGHEALPFDFKGAIGETFDYHMPVAIPGVTSTMHVEIVKRE
jgi:hypothetical protein